MHPDLSKWQAAKRSAFALCAALGASLLQQPDGTKRVLFQGQRRDFPTWLAVRSWAWQLRADQIGRGRK